MLSLKWKRLEYAANLLQRLTTDSDLVLSLTFLEYSKRQVYMPEKYRILSGKELFEHDARKLSQMLSLGYWENTSEYFIYRDAMNHLFHYLQLINSFIRMKLIKPKDVLLLEYVLIWISDPQFIEKNVLSDYIQFNFPGVIKLIDFFEIESHQQKSENT